MFHHPRYWTTKIPQSLFEQTLYETDQVFYATFPAARHAAYNVDLGQNYDYSRYTNFSTLHEDRQPLEYDIRREQESSSLVPFSLSQDGPTEELSCPPLHYDYSKVHVHPSPFSLRQDQGSYHTSPPAAPPFPPSRGPDHISIDNGSCLEDGFRQLNRHMKPPTLKFTNNCQLAVMRLDRAKDSCQIDCSLKKENDDQLCGGSSLTTTADTADTAPTEFLLNSAKSPSIGLSSLPSNTVPEKKPPLACLFCRGRKIACGPPLPGSISKTCNQCRKRSLQCHYPLESRRGMRKKKPPNSSSSDTTEDAGTKKTKKRSHK